MPECGGLPEGMEVELHYVQYEGDFVRVGYSKSFSTCVHMKTPSGAKALTDNTNYFCSTGECMETIIDAINAKNGASHEERARDIGCHTSDFSYEKNWTGTSFVRDWWDDISSAITHFTRS